LRFEMRFGVCVRCYGERFTLPFQLEAMRPRAQVARILPA